MSVAALLARVSECGYAVSSTADGPRLVPVVSGAVLPAALLADLKANRAAVVAHLTCRACGRVVCDSRHLERLRESCAACDSAKCPYKLRN